LYGFEAGLIQWQTDMRWWGWKESCGDGGGVCRKRRQRRRTLTNKNTRAAAGRTKQGKSLKYAEISVRQSRPSRPLPPSNPSLPRTLTIVVVIVVVISSYRTFVHTRTLTYTTTTFYYYRINYLLLLYVSTIHFYVYYTHKCVWWFACTTYNNNISQRLYVYVCVWIVLGFGSDVHFRCFLTVAVDL